MSRLLFALSLVSVHAATADEPRHRPSLNPPRNFEPAAHSQPINGPEDRSAASRAEKRPAEPVRIPIARKEIERETGRDDGSATERKRGGPLSMVAVLGSLAIVLGLFFAVTWALRRSMPRGTAPLPAEVVENLGRAALGARQFAHLLRLGNKLVLISVTPTGAETLAEVTDPLEVDRLAGLCRQHSPHSATASFRQIFQQFSRDRTARGFLENSTYEPPVVSGPEPRDSDAGREEFHA